MLLPLIITLKLNISYEHMMITTLVPSNCPYKCPPTPPPQGVSQDLELGCPNLLEISKQGVQIVHLQYFYM